MDLQYKTIEIVGSDQRGNGRMCGIHSTNCGVSVQVGTKLILRRATIQVQVLQNIPIVQGTGAVVDPLPKKRGRPKKVAVQYETQYVTVSEETYKAYLWITGTESCCVGFASKAFQNLYGGAMDGRVIDVREICGKSASQSMRDRSRKHNGLALAIIIS